MMRLLLIDTCGSEGNVALADGAEEKLVALKALPGRTASEMLIPTIRQSLEQEGWNLRDLAAIAVTHGPGSFTGVRVGLSAAKGLSEAGHIPLIAVSRLKLLVASAGEIEGRICAVLDAGRGEFYCGLYENGGKLEENLLNEQEVSKVAKEASVVVVCEPRVAAALKAFEPQLVKEPTSVNLLPWVVKRIYRGEFDDPATIDANYLRRTDLEILAKTIVAPRGTATKDSAR